MKLNKYMLIAVSLVLLQSPLTQAVTIAERKAQQQEIKDNMYLTKIEKEIARIQKSIKRGLSPDNLSALWKTIEKTKKNKIKPIFNKIIINKDEAEIYMQDIDKTIMSIKKAADEKYLMLVQKKIREANNLWNFIMTAKLPMKELEKHQATIKTLGENIKKISKKLISKKKQGQTGEQFKYIIDMSNAISRLISIDKKLLANVKNAPTRAANIVQRTEAILVHKTKPEEVKRGVLRRAISSLENIQDGITTSLKLMKTKLVDNTKQYILQIQGYVNDLHKKTS